MPCFPNTIIACSLVHTDQSSKSGTASLDPFPQSDDNGPVGDNNGKDDDENADKRKC